MDPMEGQQQGGSAAEKFQAAAQQKIQMSLDKSTPHYTARWVGAALMVVIYIVRVYSIAGFYIITYALGIYLLFGTSYRAAGLLGVLSVANKGLRAVGMSLVTTES